MVRSSLDPAFFNDLTRQGQLNLNQLLTLFDFFVCSG